MEKSVCVWEGGRGVTSERAASLNAGHHPHRKTAAPPRPVNTANAAEHEVRFEPVQSISEY